VLNPDLDTKALREAFDLDGRIRIDNFLDTEVIDKIRQYCLEEDPYEVIYFADGKNRISSRAEVATMAQSEKQDLNRKIFSAASQGIGFLYDGYQMNRATHKSNAKLNFLYEVFEYFNSETMLDFIRQVTGKTDILSADAHYTRLTSGQFLTRHRDVVANRDRRLAYVLGFSQNWHPDWGGLLQFFDEDGTPRDSFAPRFNCLSMFDISHIHSVTYVTPFALEPRLSLTGWFRASPKDAPTQ
jgi:Rps23 Pro-64 3,4-dihydroxylase Tpa1-like proline 4-hydroxylase